mmetsp:Transcript_33090/g.60390  ORF Transcript_33090/g.60390 Transcript_33090/m.60390 type:complete len:95 (-) Transcript_33090:211-495(-)
MHTLGREIFISVVLVPVISLLNPDNLNGWILAAFRTIRKRAKKTNTSTSAGGRCRCINDNRNRRCGGDRGGRRCGGDRGGRRRDNLGGHERGNS